MKSFTEAGGTPEKKAPNQDAPKKTVKHKPIDMVPFAQVETLLSTIRERTGETNSQISAGCGYDASTINQWKNAGEAPLRGKLAILGFACELELHKELKAASPVTFDNEELSWLFAFLIGVHVEQHRIKHLRGKVATAIAASK